MGLQGTNINGYTTSDFPMNVATDLPSTPFGADSKNVAGNNNLLTLEDSVEWSGPAFSLGAQFMRYRWLEGELPLNNYGSFTTDVLERWLCRFLLEFRPPAHGFSTEDRRKTAPEPRRAISATVFE